MGLTVTTKCLSEHMTAPKDFSYQLVMVSLRLIAEVLGLGQWGIPPTREGLTSLMPATPGLTGLSRRLRDALRPWDMLSGYGCHAFVSSR